MSQVSYPKPVNEDYRLGVLEDLALLDSEPEPEFDRLTWLASRHFGTKFAVVSLVAADRQWFKSCHGLDATETPREHAFCAHAIVQDETLIVLDARGDPRFSDNPLVVGPPNIRFYAGTRLIVNDAAVGTLCIIDDKPRETFGQDERECLRAFAQIVVDEIKRRNVRRKAAADLVLGLREAHRLAKTSESAKAQFLAMMSHELRTPLNAVIGFADCITSEVAGPLDPPEYKDFAKQIAISGKRQLNLIDRLLELTDKGTIDIQEQVMDLRELVMRCVDLLSGEALLAGLSVETRLPDSAVSLNGDPLHVEQIMLELLSNAIKFTRSGGRVCVELTFDSDMSLVFAVADTGIGIKEDALDDALAVFGQLSSGYARSHEGAGLGLPIVQKLADLHGAALSLTAPSGGGTRAQVRFPPYRTIEESARSIAAGR